MNIIFKTLPRPSRKLLGDGKVLDGVIRFEAKVFTKGESGSVWENGRELPTAADWLAQVTSEDTVVIDSPYERHPDVPPVPVPAGVLRSLPADALVAMEYWWEPAS